MDGVGNRSSALLESVGQPADLVLSLGQGHAVTRNDDHVFGLRQKRPDICPAGGGGSRGVGGGQRCQQTLHRVIGVAKEQRSLVAGVEGVFHARVTGFRVEVADDHMLGGVGHQDGHAVDGCSFRMASGRVDDVVGADDNSQIGFLESLVGSVHLHELLVVHISFGQQHVHVSGHSSGHRMDGVGNGGSAFFERVGQIADLVLGLSQGHAVARNDDHVFRLRQTFGQRILGRLFLRGSGRSGCGGHGRGLGGRSGHGGLAQQDVHQGTVHSPAHDLGQQQAGRAHDAADGHQQGVIDAHARDGPGHSAQGVQQGDGNGHVRPTHAHGEKNAKTETDEQHDHSVEHRRFGTAGHDEKKNQQEKGDGAGTQGRMTVENYRSGVQHLMQLARRDQTARQGDGTYGQSQTGRHFGENRRRPRVRQHQKRDQCRSRTAQSVEQSDHLGHLNHLDAGGHPQTQARSDQHGDPNPRHGKRAVLPQGDDDRQTHGGGSQTVAFDRRFRAVHQMDAVQNGRGQAQGENCIDEIAHQSFLNDQFA